MHNNVAFTLFYFFMNEAPNEGKIRFFLVLQSQSSVCFFSFAFCFVLTSLWFFFVHFFSLLFAFCIMSAKTLCNSQGKVMLKGRLIRPTTWFKICKSDDEDKNILCKWKQIAPENLRCFFYVRVLFNSEKSLWCDENGGRIVCVWQTVLAN